MSFLSNNNSSINNGNNTAQSDVDDIFILYSFLIR